EVFGELAEIGRVVLVAARALDGRRVVARVAACGGTRRARSPSCLARCRPARSGRRRRRVRASGVSVCLPASVRLLIPLGAELVSELPRLGISALPVAAFELAELIAAGEGEDRADAHAEFFEGELRIGEQWAYSSCGFHSGCNAWYSIEPGANSDLGRPASAAASRALITASALRRVVS